jgi:Family of unknown function (DUF5691)
MIKPLDAVSADKFKVQLLLGLSKASLPSVDDPQTQVLSHLAFLAIRERFARDEGSSINSLDTPSFDCSKPFLNAQSRQLFARIFSDKTVSSEHPVARATFLMFREYGVAFHPFDFSRFESLVFKHRELIGLNALRWCAMAGDTKNSEPISYYEGEVNDQTLGLATKAQKLSFVRSLRLKDSQRALKLIEQLFLQEPANIRAELLALLSMRLNKDDLPFLENLSTDRAASVRDLATQLLSQIAGTDAYLKRLLRIKESITIETQGLVKRTKVLKLSPLIKGKRNEIFDQLNQLLNGLRVEDIAALFNESVDSLLAIAANSKDVGDLPFFFIIRAVQDGHFQSVQKYPDLIDASDVQQMKLLIDQGLPGLNEQEQSKLIEMAVKPILWDSYWTIQFFESTFAKFDIRLPQSVASQLLDLCEKLKVSNAEGSTTELSRYLLTIAPFVTLALSQRFLSIAEQFSRSATAYHQLLLSLAQSPSRSELPD